MLFFLCCDTRCEPLATRSDALRSGTREFWQSLGQCSDWSPIAYADETSLNSFTVGSKAASNSHYLNFNNDWPATGSKVGPPGDGAKLQQKITQNPKTEVNNDMAIRKSDNDANTLMGGLWLKTKYQKTQSKLGQAVTTHTCIHGV